jgi:hypothetical protein
MLSAVLRESVAFEIGHSVPQVQAVFTLVEENCLRVWSIVPEHDRTTYRNIYAKEKQIIDQFDGVDFEFSVVSSHGRDPRTLIAAPGLHLAYIRE